MGAVGRVHCLEMIRSPPPPPPPRGIPHDGKVMLQRPRLIAFDWAIKKYVTFAPMIGRNSLDREGPSSVWVPFKSQWG